MCQDISTYNKCAYVHGLMTRTEILNLKLIHTIVIIATIKKHQ
jgi:hypothetical protein